MDRGFSTLANLADVSRRKQIHHEQRLLEGPAWSKGKKSIDCAAVQSVRLLTHFMP